jgi:hypothetical protein
MSRRSLSPPRIPSVCRLGIIGSRQDLTASDIKDVLEIITNDTGIDALYLPQEGYSSIYAESWADAHDVPVELFAAEWTRHKRAAKAIRDAGIIQRSTHLLVFGGPRSKQPLSVAMTQARKGRIVYYLAHGSQELEEITVEETGRRGCKGKESSQQPTLEQVLKGVSVRA